MFKTLPRRALVLAPLLAVLLTPNAFAAGGAGAGKVSYSDLSVMISLEKASPLLNLALADGEHFDAVELTFRAPAAGVQAKAGDDKRLDYLKIELKEVMVSSYQISGHTARLSINYARVANSGTGKTMAAEVLASTVGGANFALADGSVRFVR